MEYRERVLAALEAFAKSSKARDLAREPIKPKSKPKKKSKYSDVPTEAQEQAKLAGLLDQLTVNPWCGRIPRMKATASGRLLEIDARKPGAKKASVIS